jgi:uncharacterized protein (TIGR03435 family)
MASIKRRVQIGYVIAAVASGMVPATAQGLRQSSTASFEVATIKPMDPNGRGALGFVGYPGGRVTVGSATVKMLVHYAFDIDEHQIRGGPEWVSTSRFDVTGVDPAPKRPASTEPDRRATPTEAEREMLRGLLVERFGLKVRRSTQEAPVYLLTRGKGPLQLKPTEHPERDPRGGVFMRASGVADGEAAGINMSMTFLVKSLTEELDHPVLDRTG